jgi:hypothetical protein
MYSTRRLTVITTECKDEYGDDEKRPLNEMGDVILTPIVYLDHECGDWIIGGPAEIRLLITDLEDALKKLNAAAEPH